MSGLPSGEAIRWAEMHLNPCPASQLPQTLCGRIEFIMASLHPPLYCDCSPDCQVVVGEGEPLISKELAEELLDATTETP